MNPNKAFTVYKLKNYIKTSPGKLTLILISCILITLLLGSVYYSNYSSTKQAIQTVGKDTVPSIVAAEDIYATLADVNANAMNGILTKQKNDGAYWKTYRNEMDQVHNDLLKASGNITYGDEELKPILTIMKKLAEYENGIGSIIAKIDTVSINDFNAVNKIMREDILPSAAALDKANYSHLDSIYKEHQNHIIRNGIIFWLFSIALLAFLIYSQFYLFRETHRIINIGLFLNTVILAVFVFYASSTFNLAETKLKIAKQSAFDSIHALWKARAIAYDGNADESMYLLLNGDIAAQSQSTNTFKSNAKLISGYDSQNPNKKVDSTGFLGDELANITFEGEELAAKNTLNEWIEYINLDNKIRTLESEGKHAEAIAFCIGNNEGESNWQFKKFDDALGKTLDINQKQFNSNIRIAFDTIKNFSLILAIMLILMISLSIFGIKKRLDEYRF